MKEDSVTTLGKLFLETESGKKVPYGYTLEPAWDNNGTGSSIPTGSYRVFIRAKESSIRSYDVLQLYNVSGREAVQIHIGNYADETTGCILPGRSEGTGQGTYAVESSAVAYEQIMLHARECFDDITGVVV